MGELNELVRVMLVDYLETELGDVPLLDATATYDEESGTTALVLVNRSEEAPVRVSVGGHVELEVEIAPLAWSVVRR